MSVTDGNTDGKPGARVESPCVRLCTLDDNDVCLGCYRDIAEICAWARASEEERLNIIEAADARRLGRQSGD